MIKESHRYSQTQEDPMSSPFSPDAMKHMIMGMLFPVTENPIQKGKIEREKPKEREVLPKLSSAASAIIESVITRSATHSHKFQTLRQLLNLQAYPSTIRPIHTQMDEEFAEEKYNDLPIIEKKPYLIAAIKAYAGRRYVHLQGTTQRREEIEKDLRAVTGKIEVNKLGILNIFSAQDVVTSCTNWDGSEIRMLKPKSKEKKELFAHAMESFAVNTHHQMTTDVLLTWYGAQAIHEAFYDIGVVSEKKMVLSMERPSEAFLHCYYFGTSNVPPQFQETAVKFHTIYQEAIQANTQGNPSLLERLRGWTPEHGGVGLENVNGGFMGDSLFVERLLVKKVRTDDNEEWVHTDRPEEFRKAMDIAVATVRGEPIDFAHTIHTLLEIIRLRTLGAAIPQELKDEKFREVAHALQAYVDDPENSEKLFPDGKKFLGGVFDGKWYNASDFVMGREKMEILEGFLLNTFLEKFPKTHQRLQ